MVELAQVSAAAAKSGAMEDANVELLVSLRPDVVLVAQSSRSWPSAWKPWG